MSECNCGFQYYNGKDFVDECLITHAHALDLFGEYLVDFKKRVEEGEEAEIALWIDMKYDTDYILTEKWYHSDEFEVRNGELYQLIRI